MMWLMGGLIAIFVFPFLVRWLVSLRYVPRIDALTETDEHRTAVVFGAAVRSGYPTAVLRDRLDVAIGLYESGQVDHLIMSGDGRTSEYNEPDVMTVYAVQQGVPAGAISRDYYGLRTYDTCYRLRHVFGVSDAEFPSSQSLVHLRGARHRCRWRVC